MIPGESTRLVKRRRSAQVEVPKNELFIAKLNKATETPIWSLF